MVRVRTTCNSALLRALFQVFLFFVTTPLIANTNGLWHTTFRNGRFGLWHRAYRTARIVEHSPECGQACRHTYFRTRSAIFSVHAAERNLAWYPAARHGSSTDSPIRVVEDFVSARLRHPPLVVAFGCWGG